MRKNIASVIDAFHNHEPYREKTCRTDGKVVYSYNMVIAVRAADGAVVVVDPKHAPSATTRSHMRAVLAAFPGARVMALASDPPCSGVPLND